MPRYVLLVPADHTGTGHRIEIEAANPWQALEKSQARFNWLSAVLFDGRRPLAQVEHVPAKARGVWRIAGAEQDRTGT